jgi:hypothetical protein
MNIRKSLCVLVLLAVVAIQPALAAGPHAVKPLSGAETAQLVDVPMKSLNAGEESAVTVQTTPRDDVGFDLSELFAPKASCPGGGNATFTWTIKDGCFDGLGIYVRFFDETNDIVFPNSSQVYSVVSGRSGVVKLSVKRGAKICYGAEPSNLDGSYWGVSLDNSQGCASCCNTVPNSGNLARTVTLVCN